MSGRSSACVERLVWDQGVAGSNPVVQTNEVPPCDLEARRKAKDYM